MQFAVAISAKAERRGVSDVIRYYFDEHVGYAVAEGLRRRGVDVLTLAETDTLPLPFNFSFFAYQHEFP